MTGLITLSSNSAFSKSLPRSPSLMNASPVYLLLLSSLVSCSSYHPLDPKNGMYETVRSKPSPTRE